MSFKGVVQFYLIVIVTRDVDSRRVQERSLGGKRAELILLGTV